MVLVDSTHENQYAGFASTGYVLPPMPPDQNPERTDVVAALDEIAQDSRHYVHYEEPGLVVQGIRDVVTAARKK